MFIVVLLRICSVLIIIGAALLWYWLLKTKSWKPKEVPGVLRQPDIAPVILTIAAVFTAFMLWTFSMPLENSGAERFAMAMFVVATDLVCFLLSMPGMFWRLHVEKDTFAYRNMFGRLRVYKISDVTECIRDEHGDYRFYMDAVPLFRIDREMNAGPFLYALKQHQIPVIDARISSPEYHILETPFRYRMISLAFVLVFPMIILAHLVSGGRNPVLLILCTVLFLVLFILLLFLLGRRVEVRGSILYYRRFPGHSCKAGFEDVLYAERHVYFGTAIYRIIGKNGTLFRVCGEDTNIRLFLQKLKKEGIRVISRMTAMKDQH